MPLLDHLIELRSRLMWSLASIIVLFVAIFPFAEYVYQFLVQPLADIFEEMGGQRRLIVEHIECSSFQRAVAVEPFGLAVHTDSLRGRLHSRVQVSSVAALLGEAERLLGHGLALAYDLLDVTVTACHPGLLLVDFHDGLLISLRETVCT